MSEPTSPDTRDTLYWEDFPVGSVRDFGHHVLTAEEIKRFAAEFDPQPFHLDEAVAEAHPMFKGLAASGWHTCALVMRMMCDAYLLRSASLGSPGLEKLQWLKPVFAGDTLHARLTVIEARPMNSKPQIGLVKSRWDAFATRVDGSGNEQVLAMEGWGMFRRRAAAG